MLIIRDKWIGTAMLSQHHIDTLWMNAARKFSDDLDERVRAVCPLYHLDVTRVIWAAVTNERDGEPFIVNDAIAAMPSKNGKNNNYDTKFKRLQLIEDAGLIVKVKSEHDKRKYLVLPTELLKSLIADHLEETRLYIENEFDRIKKFSTVNFILLEDKRDGKFDQQFQDESKFLSTLPFNIKANLSLNFYTISHYGMLTSTAEKHLTFDISIGFIKFDFKVVKLDLAPSPKVAPIQNWIAKVTPTRKLIEGSYPGRFRSLPAPK